MGKMSRVQLRQRAGLSHVPGRPGRRAKMVGEIKDNVYVIIFKELAGELRGLYPGWRVLASPYDNRGGFYGINPAPVGCDLKLVSADREWMISAYIGEDTRGPRVGQLFRCYIQHNGHRVGRVMDVAFDLRDPLSLVKVKKWIIDSIEYIPKRKRREEIRRRLIRSYGPSRRR